MFVEYRFPILHHLTIARVALTLTKSHVSLSHWTPKPKFLQNSAHPASTCYLLLESHRLIKPSKTPPAWRLPSAPVSIIWFWDCCRDRCQQPCRILSNRGAEHCPIWLSAPSLHYKAIKPMLEVGFEISWSEASPRCSQCTLKTKEYLDDDFSSTPSRIQVKLVI